MKGGCRGARAHYTVYTAAIFKEKNKMKYHCRVLKLVRLPSVECNSDKTDAIVISDCLGKHRSAKHGEVHDIQCYKWR